ETFIADAHKKGVRVLFDVVPNHVHQDHPYFAAHKGSWFNHPDGSCVCGTPGCDWDSHIEDCAFAPYLPDLDWKNDEVASQISSDIVYWVDRFDADGVRIDAVPMMPRSATRRVTWELRQALENPGHKLLLMGENFTGPSGYGSLRYELGPFGLD